MEIYRNFKKENLQSQIPGIVGQKAKQSDS